MRRYRWLKIDWRGFGSTRSWFPRRLSTRHLWRPAGAFDIALDLVVSTEMQVIVDAINRRVFGDPEAPAKEFVGLEAVLDPETWWSSRQVWNNGL